MRKTNSNRAEMYRGRRVLIAGASGFIGRWVSRALTAAGAELWLISRNSSKLATVCEVYNIQGSLLEADLSKPGAFLQVYREVHPDVVFNCVGYGVDPLERDADLAWRLNCDLVREIAEAICSTYHSDWLGSRLIHTGTAAEYGPVLGPLTETSSSNPVSLYGRTKLAGTRIVSEIHQATKFPARCARLFTVYGPGEHTNRLLPSLLAKARAGETLRLTQGDQERDFTYVADVAEGLLRLAAIPCSDFALVNVATGTLTSVRRFALCASELLRLDPGQLQFGALPYAQEDVRQGPADIQRLRHLIDWIPPSSIREGIRQTLEFEARLTCVGTQV